MKTTQLAASLTAACLIAACSTPIENKKIDYRNPNSESNSSRSLEVPPDLTSIQSDTTYSIPQATSNGGGAASAAPQAVGSKNVLPDTPDAKIERQGNQRWLVVNRPADVVWREVQDFWKKQGFTIAAENPATGILETDWQENRAKLPQDLIRKTIGRVLDGLYSTGERDKFRTRLEKGAKPGTTEIYISHRGMVEVFENAAKDRTIWQPRAADSELETEMLALLQQRFAPTPVADKAMADSTKTITPATTDTSTKSANATLVADNLVVLDNFDRAWRRIGLALDRSGFTVVDRDRLRGVYYIRYADPDAKRSDGGWFSSMFSGDKSNQAEDYRLEVTEAGNKTAIRVLDKNNKEDRSETAKRILQLLFDQLK
ncbi:outer membrane protein assembly factor BamC [Chitinivorax tropicus]|uniref:Outer membrane protein assembly factor BamC n=1 Tax=Chitinivorax tropicus TaxID=714531 RepID=A0A840MQA9_9PROT|nr:outer membrane protein assembly factor BamC [Chitinivorax tropicus]MBB5019257.1 outer membrane protein assembly factor BamC [Chitinivorax tropicus]